MSTHGRSTTIQRQYLDELAFDIGLLTAVIDAYCLQAPRLLAGLQQAMADEDREAAARHAHDLASTSGQVGAVEISDLARHIEQLAGRGCHGVAGRGDQVARLLPAALRELQEIRLAYESSNR